MNVKNKVKLKIPFTSKNTQKGGCLYAKKPKSIQAVLLLLRDYGFF